MKAIHSLFAALVVAGIGATALAATEAEHESHHPAGVTPSWVSPPIPSRGGANVQSMNDQMKKMHEMHSKMMAATTPEARQALMAEHMKTMQEGMSMMNMMAPGNGAGMGAPGSMAGMTGAQSGAKNDRTKDGEAQGAASGKSAEGAANPLVARQQMMEQRMDMMQSMMQMMMDRMSTDPQK